MTIKIDGATVRPVAIVTEGEPAREPLLVIEGCEVDGRPVRLRIVGGVGASAPVRELADAAHAVVAASERAESGRMRIYVEQILGNRGGDAA